MERFKVTNIFNYFNSHAKPLPPVPKALWRRPLYLLALGLGSGALPFAPGTMGTLLAIPFYLLLRPLSLVSYIIFVIFFTLISMWICDRVSRDMGVPDHPRICLDEMVGFFVTMIGAPQYWYAILLGFFLFRIFDIWKPWPIRWLDNTIHGGIGIVLDDVAAGIYGLIILQLVKHLPL